MFGIISSERRLTPIRKDKKPRALRYLWPTLGKHYGRYTVLAALCAGAEVVLEVFIPMLMSTIVDGGLYRENTFMLQQLFSPELVANRNRFVLTVGGIMVAVACVSMGFGLLSARFSAVASQGFAKNLRSAMLGKIQSFSFANIDKFSTPSLITRGTTDVNTIRDSMYMCIRTLFRSPIMLIMATVMAFQVSSKLALIFLPALPLLAVILLTLMKIGQPRFRKMLLKMDNMNRAVQENLISSRVVKAYVRGDYESERFEVTAEELKDSQLKSSRLFTLIGPVQMTIMWTVSIIILLVGGKDILFDRTGLLTGELISIISYTTQAVGSLSMMSWLIMGLSRAQASLIRINEVMDEEVDICDGESNDAVPDGRVDFEDVCFSYTGNPDRLEINHINLHIDSGETVGVIGGTGEGKSTLVNLIPRFYDTLSGAVKVGGRDVREYTLKNLRDGVSMVLQNGTLFSGSIAENLRWGDKNATDEELRAACAIACADEFIDSFPEGYETQLEQNASNLSGGQKQRLRIARALVKKPKILILDDSTSAVDMTTDEHIRRGLKTAMPGTTKIIIAQRIASIMSCDRIVVLDEGRLSDVGTHAELLRRSHIYRDVYESQMHEEVTADAEI